MESENRGRSGRLQDQKSSPGVAPGPSVAAPDLRRIARGVAFLALVLIATPPAAPGGRVSPLAAIRDAVAAKGEEIGLDAPPATPEKAAIAKALERLDRPRESLLDDLRAAVPVVRALEGAFPGDPALGPAMDSGLALLGQEIHGEQQMLLGLTDRARTSRDLKRLQRGVQRLNEYEARFGGEPDRAARARILLLSCRIADRTERQVRLDLPRMEAPRFEGVGPDFSLLDVNPASATAGLPVSPRDYLGKVTVVFFMAST